MSTPNLVLNQLKVPVTAMPALIVGYIAWCRADYYATADDARGDGKYADVLAEEFRHALRDRSEIKDWMENNMDLHLPETNGLELEANA